MRITICLLFLIVFCLPLNGCLPFFDSDKGKPMSAKDLDTGTHNVEVRIAIEDDYALLVVEKINEDSEPNKRFKYCIVKEKDCENFENAGRYSRLVKSDPDDCKDDLLRFEK